MQKLTATIVKNATSLNHKKVIRRCDGNGLYLTIEGRSKRWELRIKTLAGKDTFLGLGSIKDLTLKEARQFTLDTHAARAKGIEPKHFVRQRRGKGTPSFQEITEQWLLIQKKRLKTSTYMGMEKRYKCHILESSLGCTPIKLVTSEHIYEFLNAFDRKGQIPTLNKLFSMITSVLDYSATFAHSESLDISKMKGLFSRHRSKPHASIEVNGLGELITLVATSKLKLSIKLMFELQILLGTRCCETVQMKWADICEANWLWTLPPEICKNGLQHEIPLSSQAISALKLAKQLAAGSQYVFPSPHTASGDKSIGKSTLNNAFISLGLKSQMTGHGTRAISETTMHEHLGSAETLIIEAIHSHTDTNKIRNVYNRKTFFNDRKKALVWWGNHYSKIVDEKTCSYFVQKELETLQ